MKRTRRIGGPRPLASRWPWSDRGRSAVTQESVVADIARLDALLAEVMQKTYYSGRPIVVVRYQGWK
jgi:hypothetical protein